MKRIDIFLPSALIARLKNTHSSSQWLERQRRDPYVKRAVKETYRARSAFKLLEINERFRFISPGDRVVDLGATPGSWTQVAVQLTNSAAKLADKPRGLVIGVDRSFIEPIEGATVLSHSDITDPITFEAIRKALDGKLANAVISDMVCMLYSN